MAWRSNKPRPCPLQDFHSIGLQDCDVVNLTQAMNICGFWRLDIDQGHLYGTPHVSKLYELDHSEGPLNVKDLCDRMHPQDVDQVMDSYYRAATSRGVFHSIHRIITTSGTLKYIRTVGLYHPVEGGSGEYRGMLHELFQLEPTASFIEL
ncbi:PAS domain-containing protein [Agrobacterium vitis]|uniref:PAS domain-containing protein n=1 Tax=Agrobacterium vitis TaxID=373 RepID=A0ABD6G4Z3_AGRVI|nr:PAS domain-containing protein [Agrobacterium vitis]MUO80134.1 PAS domain-containing protein [Agrobacterium vitis]MUO97353.1 PAS domain-containing protein [Agrobacterium vitis]MUP03748.1 PAS domain-containing protein [Agrobacterium vitis]MUZ82570.1 PAS domain-containing protein [Agrobacterium vitis]MVA09911.1 PAS domain-containing protein [Agrobacterium vitis]